MVYYTYVSSCEKRAILHLKYMRFVVSESWQGKKTLVLPVFSMDSGKLDYQNRPAGYDRPE
ncbi:MAG: hypothetical protein K9M75_06295 [Phycisphaerae bacterium]|nr:hypothetical protein [Phycisphaerae bacterium]